MKNMDCFLTEEEVKHSINEYYIARGYSTTVAWGHSRGADIVAEKGNERLIIEVKGCGSLQPMRVNYFLSILGEVLQRMDSEDCKYFIALPKIQQYVNLWYKLPALAKQRTKISLILVDNDRQLEFLD
jgi:hypothetical protein